MCWAVCTISQSQMDGFPSQTGCKFSFSYLPSVGDSSFKSSRHGFTFKSFLYRAKGKWRSTTVKLYIARPHMMPIKWNQLCSTKHFKTTQRNPDEMQCFWHDALHSYPMHEEDSPCYLNWDKNRVSGPSLVVNSLILALQECGTESSFRNRVLLLL